MSLLVVDASVVISWLLDDENEPLAYEALERLVEEGAIVPELWHLETRNALLVAERRGRLSGQEVGERLGELNDLPIRTDREPSLQSAFELARSHELTIYDATYLDLAMRHGAELATLDRALNRAAVAEGVAFLAP